MKKITFIALLLGIISFSVAAQVVKITKGDSSYLLKGKVLDDVSKENLVNASISVINSKDSLLRDYTIAAQDGTFEIKSLSAGEFTLIVTYNGYADFVENFKLDSANTTHDFGAIAMVLKSILLNEVIIKGNPVQIRQKGDTTEYDAKAFVVQPNAKVEDLLKQLPGIQVDRQGNITAQGEAVTKVLVDGEEFFGDDPTLVTKNIRADMVDKVQLFDKKTDQATFTGIDDGKKSKTINLKLKEDKNTGYFGKIDGGVGTDGYYRGQLLYNSFKGKRKISVYGLLGNDGRTGLGWQDNSKYASSIVELLEPGVIIDLGSSDQLETFSGKYNGEGIPTVRSGGGHYDNKWDSDKNIINANYKIGSLAVDGDFNTLTQNSLPSVFFNSNANKNFHDYMLRQKADLTYQRVLDSTSTIKFNFEGTIKSSETNSTFGVNGFKNDSILTNKNIRNIRNNGESKFATLSQLYNKKFKRQGRTLSLNLVESFTRTDYKGYLNSQTSYFDEQSNPESSENLDQYKVSKQNSDVLYGNLTYSHPLSNTFKLLLNYSMSYSKSYLSQNTFNRNIEGTYNKLDSLYSNDFRLTRFLNQGGVMFNYAKKDLVLNFGTKISSAQLRQLNVYPNTLLNRNFTLWSPQIGLQSKISKYGVLRLNYWGTTEEPTASQLQPVTVNIDPLNLYVGNSLLRPTFKNRLFFGYQSGNQVKGELIGLFGNIFLYNNPIVNSAVTLENGRTTIQPINLPGYSPTTVLISGVYDRKIKSLDLNAGLNLNITGNTGYDITNGAVNKTDLFNYSILARITKAKEKKYDLNLAFGPTFTAGGSSLLPQLNNNGRGLSGNGSATIYLPGNIIFSLDADYLYNSKTEIFDQNFSRLLLNSSISKVFLKKENLKFSFSGNDLLNQNKGFNRTVIGNLITQNTYTTIRRYFMFSLVYDFDKTQNDNK